MTAINQVYAMCIQPNQIIERITFVGIDPTLEAIEEERHAFLEWLNKRFEALGFYFPNQLVAWEAYDIKERFERGVEKIAKFSPSATATEKTWMGDIVKMLEDLALSNAQNYNELGGQQ